MPELIVGSRAISLRPSDVVGKGGEADVYAKGGEAYKIFKPPTHPDLVGFPQLQQEAKARIAEQQHKLPTFPHGLPKRVIVPEECVRDKAGHIAGYRMAYLPGTEVLYRYGERGFRDQGISDDTVRSVLVDLYHTVEGVHRADVVVGDFNDLNILVKEEEAYVIDADSMQFGEFPARMFTARFVDPLICDPRSHSLMMVKPHSPETDWYGYLIMVMQSLLFVGPYGGVYRPKDQQKAVAHDARPLSRITVFDPEVIYPRPARPYKILPDDLLHHLHQVFKKDKRGTPPLALIENLRFTTCSACGLVHARGVCPDCVGVTPTMIKEVHLGKVKGTKVFETSGRILYATTQGGALRYLYHHDGAYRREGDRIVVEAPLDPFIRFRIRGAGTILARGTQALVFEEGATSPRMLSVDTYGTLPLLDANESTVFYASGGGLYRESPLGADYRERVGDILANQTLFWVGERSGFGFYRAADLSMYFVFDPKQRGLNDSVNLPAIRGQLVDSTAVFGADRVWFFTSTQEGTDQVNRCFLVNAQGLLLGTAEGRPGDGTWLGKLRGACAVHDFLLVPTDDGVARVGLLGPALSVTKEFPDTHRFVDSSAGLFANSEGLFAVGRREIWQLTIS